MEPPIPYVSIEGKTYSLFGKSSSTSGYYQLISEVANIVLEKCSDPEILLHTIQDFSKKKRTLRKIVSEKENASLISYLLHLLNSFLANYTENVHKHLQNLPIRKRWDKALSTTREQYHLFMLEIELTNRINIESFLQSNKKMALLPYCMKDFDAGCKSTPDDFDYQCKLCSKYCYQNYLSRLLKKHDIEAYIWMGSGIKEYSRKILMNNQTLAILGIACIPELVFGMRKCQKYHIPAIGIPLDANRCARWMDSFHKNSVNLEQLEILITENKRRRKSNH